MVGIEISRPKHSTDLLSHKACFPTPSEIWTVAFSVIVIPVFVSAVDFGIFLDPTGILGTGAGDSVRAPELSSAVQYDQEKDK